MKSIYSYYNYEESFYHAQYLECVKIGKYLLARLKDKKSKKLLRKLKRVKYKENLSKKKITKIINLLWEIKVQLMVWENWL